MASSLILQCKIEIVLDDEHSKVFTASLHRQYTLKSASSTIDPHVGACVVQLYILIVFKTDDIPVAAKKGPTTTEVFELAVQNVLNDKYSWNRLFVSVPVIHFVGLQLQLRTSNSSAVTLC